MKKIASVIKQKPFKILALIKVVLWATISLFVVPTQLTSATIYDIKGTYSTLADGYKYLSPVNGALWAEKGLAEKYYKFGDPEHYTNKLLKHLFIVNNGAFVPSTNKSYVAAHVSHPATIAKIMACIEKVKAEYQNASDQSKAIKQASISQAQPDVEMQDARNNSTSTTVVSSEEKSQGEASNNKKRKRTDEDSEEFQPAVTKKGKTIYQSLEETLYDAITNDFEFKKSITQIKEQKVGFQKRVDTLKKEVEVSKAKFNTIKSSIVLAADTFYKLLEKQNINKLDPKISAQKFIEWYGKVLEKISTIDLTDQQKEYRETALQKLPRVKEIAQKLGGIKKNKKNDDVELDVESPASKDVVTKEFEEIKKGLVAASDEFYKLLEKQNVNKLAKNATIQQCADWYDKTLEKISKIDLTGQQKTDKEKASQVLQGVKVSAQALKKNQDDLEIERKELNKLDTDKAMERLKDFVHCLVESLKECGFLSSDQQKIYIPYTTHTILLSFLYKSARNKGDFYVFFKTLQEHLGDTIFDSQHIKKLTPEWANDIYEEKEYLKIMDKVDGASNDVMAPGDILSQIPLEDIIHKIIKLEQTSQPLPAFTDYRSDVKFHGRRFPNCADSTVLNLCNIIKRDKNLQDYLACEFYGDVNNADESRVSTFDTHQNWLTAVENRPFIVYRRVLLKSDLHAPAMPYIEVPSNGIIGFIHKFQVPKDKIEKAEKITLSSLPSSNSKEETFNMVTINGEKFILVDSDKYVLYEMQATLRNNIILLNQIFDLNIFEKQKMEDVFCDPDFNKKYMTRLCEYVGWSFDQKIDLKEAKDKEIEISLKTNNNNFDLNVNYLRHAYVTNNSSKNTKIDVPVFIQLLHSCIDVANKNEVTKNLALQLSVFNKMVGQQLQDKLRLCYGDTYHYLEDINDNYKKLEIIKLIFKVDNCSLATISLCSRLIASLPIQEDMWYHNTIFSYLINDLADKKIDFKDKNLRNDISFFLKNTLNIIQTKNNITVHTNLGLLKKFIQIGYEPAFTSATTAAETAVLSVNCVISSTGLDLFKTLFDKGYESSFDSAITAAETIVASANDGIRSTGLILFRSLVDKGHEPAFTKATTVAEAAAASYINNIKCMGLDLFKALVDKDHKPAFTRATTAVEAAAASANDGIRSTGLFLFRSLVDKGHKPVFAKATMAAEEAMVSHINNIKYTGLDLFKALVDKDHKSAFTNATMAAETAVLSYNDDIKLSGLDLFKALVDKDHESAFANATMAAETAVTSAYDDIKLSGLDLFKALVNKNHASAFANATTVAEIAVLGNNTDAIRLSGLDLFTILVNKNHEPAFTKATIVAETFVASDNHWIKSTSLKLFEALVNKYYKPAFDSAITAAEMAVLNDNYGIRLSGLNLFKALFKARKISLNSKIFEILNTDKVLTHDNIATLKNSLQLAPATPKSDMELN